MQKITRTGMAIMAIASLLTWFSCSKSSHTEINSEATQTADVRSLGMSATNLLVGRETVSPSSVPALCGTTIVKQFLKNTTSYGTIVVGNDATDYYITINGNSGSTIKNIRLYAGTEAGIPVNSGNGMPKHNEFPVQENFSTPYPASWALKIPISEVGNEFWVSVRTIFMTATGEQVLWSEGITFPPSNTGSKFSFARQECIIDEGCAFGQGYWYGNGNISWPDVNGSDAGNITVGDEFYTRDEARAIWWANNGDCPGIPNAKKAFAFVSAIRLSGDNVIGNASLWDDMETVDNWLASLVRLTPENICSHPSAPTDVMVAVARLGAWMDEHECE
jgi:hypothetical protein